MKKFGAENNVKSEHEFSGLTITELEKQLITEEPESGIKYVFHAVMRWGRLLIVLSLALILIYGVCYIQSLKKEISDLRRELNAQTDGIAKEVDTGQYQPAAENPPDVSQAENTGENQPAAENPPDVSQADNTGGNQSASENQPGGLESPPQNKLIIHSIQSGDNLSTICNLYYGNEDFAPYLAVLNNISPDSQLNVGQEIMVPEKPYESWTVEDR